MNLLIHKRSCLRCLLFTDLLLLSDGSSLGSWGLGIAAVVLLMDELLVLEVVEVCGAVRAFEHLRISDKTLVDLTGGLRLSRSLLVVCHVLSDPGIVLLVQPHLVRSDPVLLVVGPLLLVRVLVLLVSAISVGSVGLLIAIVVLHVSFLGEERLGSVLRMLSLLCHGGLLEQFVLQTSILRLVVLEQ